MQKEPLDLHHKKILQPFILKKKSLSSEYSFANLYLFRKVHQYEVMSCGESLFLRGVSRSGKSYSIPFCPLTPQNIERELNEVSSLYALSEHEAEAFSGEAYKKYFLESESDYLYLKESFLEYAALKKKGLKIKKLKEKHEVQSKKIEKSDDKDLFSILEQWQKGYKEESDIFSCEEGIEKREILGLEGEIIYLDKKPVAFFLAEKDEGQALLLHFAKASVEVDGLYPLLYQRAASSALSEKYINLEQDMGDPSLRKSKLSFHPEKMEKKFHIEKELLS